MEDIVIRNLCKSFAGKPVLRDFSAVLPVGQVTGLMAPSGAGKTTLLRILMGLERPDGGTIDGLAGLRLSAVFQEDRLLEHLDARDNLRFVLGAVSPDALALLEASPREDLWYWHKLAIALERAGRLEEARKALDKAYGSNEERDSAAVGTIMDMIA